MIFGGRWRSRCIHLVVSTRALVLVGTRWWKKSSERALSSCRASLDSYFGFYSHLAAGLGNWTFKSKWTLPRRSHDVISQPLALPLMYRPHQFCLWVGVIFHVNWCLPTNSALNLHVKNILVLQPVSPSALHSPAKCGFRAAKSWQGQELHRAQECSFCVLTEGSVLVWVKSTEPAIRKTNSAV